MQTFARLLCALGLCTMLASCSSDSSKGSETNTDAGKGNAGEGNAGEGNAGQASIGGNSGTGSGGRAGAASSVGGTVSDLCGGTCICDNGLDDDGDGLVDGFDPECTGPFDNDEGSFATGIPGDNRDPKWQDCFFDGNSGAGDDGCRYHTDCLTGAVDLTDDKCALTDACIAFCQPLTSNGCDCFGCCTIVLASGTSVDVLTGSSCSVADAADEDACPRCIKSELCANDCGECELCAGKTIDDLPETCGNTSACDEGLASCTSSASCPSDSYCSQGCCIVAVR
jgi:hypothetical protein